MKENLISVILPIYNVSDYLDRCMKSVINQTYKNIEIIMVDDGSTDDSALKCDEYKEKDDRIVVFHKENGGLSDARNYGIKRASGNYITCIDSDDFIDLDYIEYLYNLINKYNAKCQYVNTESYIAMAKLKSLEKAVKRSFRVKSVWKECSIMML